MDGMLASGRLQAIRCVMIWYQVISPDVCRPASLHRWPFCTDETTDYMKG